MIAFVIFVTYQLGKVMNEAIKNLQRSMKVVQAKVAFLKEGVDGLNTAVDDMSADLDIFVDVYNESQQRNEDRLDRIEKHVGLV